MNDQKNIVMMKRCIELARKAKANGNTPVGSLILLNDKIIAETEELTPTGNDMFAHSEIEAVRIACDKIGSEKLDGAVLYTTVEPCFLCSYAIRQTGISRVVMGYPTPHIGGVSSQYPILTANDIGKWGDPPEVVFGVMEGECRALFE